MGGTKIATGIVDPDGNVLDKVIRPTEVPKGERRVIDNIFETIYESLSIAGLSIKEIGGIGIGSPGPLSVKEGVVISAPTLGWFDVPIRDLVATEFGVTTVLDNDTNVAGLAELWYGAGKDSTNMIYISVSTGIGSGLLLNRKLYRGTNDYAGEIGCITVLEGGPLCSCGRKGCLEALASGTAMANNAKESIRNGAESMILDLVAGDIESITALTIAEADKAGDQLAGKIIDSAIKYLSIGISNLISIFNPDTIVIGGGVSNLGDRLFIPLTEQVKNRALKAPAAGVKILPSQLGGEVGIIGAAALVSNTDI